jgi:acyl-CoA synthetase (NDP forming)
VISVLATPLAYPAHTAELLAEHGVTILHGHAAAARAIAGLIRASQSRRPLAPRCVPRAELNIAAGVLDETEAAAMLTAYGILRPREFVATSPERVAEWVQGVGCRSVVKLVCAEVPHKAREGLVRLGLETPADARRAAQEIRNRARELGVDDSRLLVQEQLTAGPEFLLGVSVDALYGPALTLRPGGAGVSGDSEFHLLPLHQGEAAELAIRAAAQLPNALSEPDLRALTEAVERFAWLAVDLADRLLEIEANPIIVTGGRAVAVDALAVAKDPTQTKDPGGGE